MCNNFIKQFQYCNHAEEYLRICEHICEDNTIEDRPLRYECCCSETWCNKELAPLRAKYEEAKQAAELDKANDIDSNNAALRDEAFTKWTNAEAKHRYCHFTSARPLPEPERTDFEEFDE